MTREQEAKRYNEFPQPIQMLGQQEPRVDRIIRLFVLGDIITKEEALCRMVIELSKDVEYQRRNMIEMMSRNGTLYTAPAPQQQEQS